MCQALLCLLSGDKMTNDSELHSVRTLGTHRPSLVAMHCEVRAEEQVGNG